MRKLFTIIILLACLPALAGAATLNFTPTITITALTTTTMRIQLAGLRATGIDTIKVYSAASDSVTGPKYWFKAAVTKDTTVASLTPGKTYIFKVRADSAGTYRTSVPDTAQTYYPRLNDTLAETITDDFRNTAKATAWPATNVYTYGWTLSTSTARDSSLVFNTWPYNGATIISTGDSAVYKVRVMAGYSDYSTASSPGAMYYTPVDSLSITAKGTQTKSWSIPVGAKHYYYQLIGATGNGNATGATIYNRRNRQ